ncbi:hypothetical protein SEA_HIRKO_72 [Arthrobacter phage Hirko]|nr:hypothetical protein SEA_HIRKO_72 [Arthrobacter phage Hirko]
MKYELITTEGRAVIHRGLHFHAEAVDDTITRMQRHMQRTHPTANEATAVYEISTTELPERTAVEIRLKRHTIERRQGKLWDRRPWQVAFAETVQALKDWTWH